MEDDHQPEHDKKIAGIEWMAHEGIGAAVTHSPLADRGVTAPGPQAQPLPQCANADPDPVGQGIEKLTTPRRDRPQADHGEEDKRYRQGATVATQPYPHALLRRRRTGRHG